MHDEYYSVEPREFVLSLFKFTQFSMGIIILINIIIPVTFSKNLPDFIIPIILLLFSYNSYKIIMTFSLGYFKTIQTLKINKERFDNGYIVKKNKEFFGVVMPYIKNILSYLIISIVYNAYMLYIINYYTIV